MPLTVTPLTSPPPAQVALALNQIVAVGRISSAMTIAASEEISRASPTWPCMSTEFADLAVDILGEAADARLLAVGAAERERHGR